MSRIAVVVLALAGPLPAAGDRVPLLEVSMGRMPNDTAFDGKSQLGIEQHEALGGKALKVVYAAGDSFGVARGAGVRDWTPYAAVEFPVVNPSRTNVNLVFSIRHRGTTNFRTRVDVPVALAPGRTNVRLPLADMVNVDRSSPDLSDVRHWYLACGADARPTLYFGNFVLVRAVGRVATDPARLARIRATKMPKIDRPIAFDTPEADAILAALEVFPPGHAINQIVEDWPVHPNSRNIVASIGAEKPLRYNPDMAFVLVPPEQPRVPVRIVEYGAESDPGPFPVPNAIPIEGWPVVYRRGVAKPPTLAEVLRRPAKYEGDRHAIVVDPQNRMLFEFFTFGRTARGWAAGQASVFDLKTNKLRPDGWTSADAAGLPIFPTVVRYDELKRGVVEHAMRVTVRRSRRSYVHPATHFASRLTDENLPRMGERFRLRADFDVAPFSPNVRTILEGLKKYGMLVADNGIEWAISVTPDPRIPVIHEELRRIRGSDFEVIVAPTE